MSATFQPRTLAAAPKKAQRGPVFIEFFKHHGAWAPGVKLFRNIDFTAKAILISTVFMLPILFLAYAYVSAKQEVASVAELERVGTAYAKEIIPLMRVAQLNRMAATAAAKGSAPPNASDLASQYDSALKRLADVETKHGAAIGTAEFYKAFTAQAGAARAASGGPDSVFAAHTKAIEELSALLDQALDGSGLSLDPAIETYYLMDAAMVRAPNMAEAMAKMRGVGNAVLLAGEITPAQSSIINQNFPMASFHSKGFDFGLDKVLKARPDLKTDIEHGGVSKAMRDYLNEVERIFLKGELVKADREAFVALANKAIDGQFELNARLITTLDKLLAERDTQTLRERNVALVILFLCVALAFYMFRSFHLVTHGGLREVQRHLESMTDGDLTTSPKPWGNDEAARLMFTLSDMQHSLRAIVTQVRGTSESIVQASTQIASASADLSSRTEETAANLEESAASVEQVSSTVKNTADNARQAADIASSNTKVAERGGDVITKVVTTMETINSSSSKISDIIGTIDGIAFQTNILALNAAVEAARAGEQGRGFAVVASEVRSLAQRSAEAAKEIKVLISGSVQQVREGAEVVQVAGDAISEIVTSAKQMNSIINEISVASHEQSSGISQVSASVQELDRMTQQNAALVEETAAAAASLNQQAVDLAKEVARFKLP
jgi:methyl-accepting chemotaxis protein